MNIEARKSARLLFDEIVIYPHSLFEERVWILKARETRAFSILENADRAIISYYAASMRCAKCALFGGKRMS